MDGGRSVFCVEWIPDWKAVVEGVGKHGQRSVPSFFCAPGVPDLAALLLLFAAPHLFPEARQSNELRVVAGFFIPDQL